MPSIRAVMKPTRSELAVLLIVAGIIAYSIFIPPLIGLADSGDFGRIIPWRGLSPIPTEYDERYFYYFNSKYRIIPKWETPDWYKTSTSLLIEPARWLSIKIGQDQIFDIRILAAIYALILVMGIWLVLAGTRSLRVGTRVTLSILLILIFTDVGYIAYFNSFYSEGTGLSFLAVGVGTGLILQTQRSASILLLVGYFSAMAMVVAAKPMYAILAPAFALFGIHLSRFVNYPRRYVVSGSLACALCLIGAWDVFQAPPGMQVDAAYIGIFMDLLPNSGSPEQDLTDLGLRPEYAIFSGTTPYQSDTPLKKSPQFRNEFSTQIKSYTLPMFYLSHPKSLYWLCVRCMNHAFSTRVDRLGYYEASTGKPPLTKPFGLWSVVRESVFPRFVLFLGLFVVTGIAAVVLLVRTSSSTFKSMLLLYILFVLVGVVEFFVAAVAGGGEPDAEKHLFMFNLAFDVCLILLVLGAANRLQASNLELISKLTRFRILRPHQSNHVT